MSAVVVDTNVAVTANGSDLPHGVTAQCVAACARRLREVQQRETVVVDNGWLILNEYKTNVNERGQPGAGDAWLKWLLTNHANPHRCHKVTLTPVKDGRMFEEFPDDPDLARFDASDRKFVAASRTHGERPPVLNAVDSDWQDHQAALARHGVDVRFLCPDYLPGRGGRNGST